jgi:hypothetical protein
MDERRRVTSLDVNLDPFLDLDEDTRDSFIDLDRFFMNIIWDKIK